MKNQVGSHATSAVSLLLKSDGPGKVDTTEVVSSLSEVAHGLQAEGNAALSEARALKTSCRSLEKDMKVALDKGQRTIDIATDDKEKANAQVRSLQASLDELKGQISRSNAELDSLQSRLKKIRTDKGLLKKSATKSLQQVEAVLVKQNLWETPHHKSLSALKQQVSGLEELSKSLSLLQMASRDDRDKQAPTLILRSDKQDVVKASNEAQKGFNEEEERILDLVEVERKTLQDLEDNMADLQPAISNKLQQAMEVDRVLQAAQRANELDTLALKISREKCSLMDESLDAQQKKRAQVTSDVLMASKLLERMDTAVFLAKDMQSLRRSALSLVQSASWNSNEFLGSGVLSLIRPVSLLQQEVMVASDLEISYSALSGNEGVFDSVTHMISGLIASLKAQANGDVNQHQFCQDSLGKNRRHRIAKKLSIDTLSSTIRMSKMAIARLDDNLQHSADDVDRLNGLERSETNSKKKETIRVKKQLSEHKLANEVMEKVVVILSQLCNLDGAGALLIERSSSSPALRQGFVQQQESKKGSRFSQCKEASELLKSASSNVKGLDSITQRYLDDYDNLFTRIQGTLSSAKSARESEQASGKAARAQRASELATAQKDVKEAGKELKLIEDAKQELELSCSHVETPEEKMARRQEEIDALKEGLKVLEGDAIPA